MQYYYFLCRLLFRKVVITIHDVDSFATLTRSSFIKKWIYNLSSLILTHNKFSRNQIVNIIPSRTSKITIIPHGNYIPFIHLGKNKFEARNKLKIPLDKKQILLFFGMIKQVKGLEILLLSLKDIIKEYNNVLLLVAGRVPDNDFSYSFNRAANPDTESPVAELYLGDIIGVQEVLDGEANEISGITVIDDRYIQIKIDSPKAYFLAKLTYPTAYVLKEANVNKGGDNWTDSPVVTGPFALERYDLGQVLILKRNDLYRGDKAKLDRVEFNLAGGVPMAMYENGEIDITGVGLADLERVQDQNDPLSRDLISVPPSFTISYIGFNVSKPAFDDLKFR